MSSIPVDLHLDILSRLPVKSVSKCKCVCKSWFSDISKPNFAKKHFDDFTLQKKSVNSLMLVNDVIIYSLRYDSIDSSSSLSEFRNLDVEIGDYPFNSKQHSIRIVGSCNGLVCLNFYDKPMFGPVKDFYCIWNPSTKEFKEIPEVPGRLYHNRVNVRAFGYDRQNDDYKLLVLESYRGFVYGLGTGFWKENFAYSGRIPEIGGVTVNGNLHWLENKGMACLDFSTEKPEKMDLPTEYCENQCSKLLTLGVLDECLSVLFKVAEVGVEAWVMQEYGVKESWTKRFVITNEVINNVSTSWEKSLKILREFKNGQVLFMDGGKLILYDPKDRTAIARNLTRLEGVVSEVNYLESLVSLNSGTYVGRG